MLASIERNFTTAAKNSKYFKKLLGTIKKQTVKEQDKGNDPEILAEAVHEALTARFPHIAYSVKPDPQRVVLNSLPDWMADPLLKLVLKG